MATMIPEWTLADRMRKARQVAGLNQRDFAERLQVTPGSYSSWEAGNSRPRDVVSIAQRIEMLTQIPAEWTLGLEVRHVGLEPTTRCLGEYRADQRRLVANLAGDAA